MDQEELLATAEARYASSEREVTRLSADNDLMSAGLTFARLVLDEMLPNDELVAGEWKLAGRLIPAQRVGGDLFSYVLEGRHIHFLVADAVGHGLGSTLLVYECRALWRALCVGSLGVGERISLLNRLLWENLGPERFVAACAGTLDLTSGRIDLAMCGIAPVFVCTDEDSLTLLQASDPPLGIFEEHAPRVHVVDLSPRGSLLVATDGVMEWRGSVEEEFGEERVAQLLEANYAAQPIALLDTLFRSLEDFSQGNEQIDDACAVVIQRQSG